MSRWRGWFCGLCIEPNRNDWKVCHNCYADKPGWFVRTLARLLNRYA